MSCPVLRGLGWPVVGFCFCRQLERTQSSAAASSSQLKALRADVAGRDAEIGKLQRELEALRKRLHTLHVRGGFCGLVGGQAWLWFAGDSWGSHV